MPDLVFATKGQAAALRAQEQMKEAAKQHAAELKKTTAEADKTHAAILKIYESTKTPVEQLKQRMEVLRKSIKDGSAPPEAMIALQRLKEKYNEAYGSANAAVAKTTKEVKKLTVAQDQGFATGKILSWGTALKTAAVAAVVASFKTIADERKKLAADDKAAIQGEGGLAQFASSPDEQAAFLGESRAAYALGVGADRGSAANALGSMLGAGITNPQDRLMLMRMQSAGLIDNAGEVAKAAKTLQSTYGGNLLPYLDRSFGAGDIAPGGASQLMIASSRSALTAKALGMVPDEVIAGTAALAAGTGSESEGATLLDALLRALDKAGGFEGKSLNATVREITERVGAGENLRGDTLLGGRAEAVRAYRFLAGQEGGELYKRALQGSYQAAQSEAGISKLETAESDPNTMAARFNIIRERRREISKLEDAAFENISQGIYQTEAARTEQLPSLIRPLARAALDAGNYIQGFRDPEEVARGRANDPLYSNSPANMEAKKLIEGIDKQREIMAKQLKVLENLDSKSDSGGLIIGGD